MPGLSRLEGLTNPTEGLTTWKGLSSQEGLVDEEFERLLEDGDFRLLENGDVRLLEGA